MSNVTLAIGGRSFTVSAPDGEEAHIEMLGRMIAERAARGGGGPGQSEPRMLLFAALMLADELHEAHRQAAPPPAPPPAPSMPEPELPSADVRPAAEVIARIETLAARVEKLAAHFEEPAS